MDSISVVIPTFNRAHILGEVLPTYLSQDGVIEVIIVDDGSKDNTATIIEIWKKKDNRIIYLKHHQRLGLPTARNTGASMAKGEYVFYGEDDVILKEKTVAILLACIKSENADIAGCRTMYMMDGETTEDTIERYNKISLPVIDMKLFKFNFGTFSRYPLKVPFVQAIALIKKEILQKIKYDKQYWGSAYREETDFFIRCSKSGYSLVFCPVAIALNLPRIKGNPGGQHAISPMIYEISAILNNLRMLWRHYSYLHDKWGLEISPITLQAQFTLQRSRMLLSKVKASLLK